MGQRAAGAEGVSAASLSEGEGEFNAAAAKLSSLPKLPRRIKRTRLTNPNEPHHEQCGDAPTEEKIISPLSDLLNGRRR